VLCHGNVIDVRHLPDELQPHAQQPVTADASSPRFKLEQAEADVLRSALTHTHGSISKTAEELGVSRTTLWRKMRRLGISAEDYRER
jgi:transcriptional regulator of acetoin/glycerol metabolism